MRTVKSGCRAADESDLAVLFELHAAVDADVTRVAAVVDVAECLQDLAARVSM